MAHNSDRLAWDSLASMLELRRTNPCQHDAYNLHALIQPSSRGKLANFVDIFAQSIAEDAAQQRKQYPQEYEVPGGNEVIISDEATTKIESTVRRWHPESYWPDDDGEVDPETFKQPTSKELCPHTNESDICGCVLPYKERMMSAFQRPQVQNDCFKFDTENLESFRNLKVVQSLILHGEMDPVLRSCAYEECQLAKWWEHRECYCTQQTFGWRSICEHAIRMYIILNVLHQFTEIWDIDGSRIDNYRNLAVYQQAVRSSTVTGDGNGSRDEIAKFSHRDFLGIEEDQFSWIPEPHNVPRWKHIMSFDTNGFEMYQKGLDAFSEPWSSDSDDSDDDSDDASSIKSGNNSSADNEDDSSDGIEEKDSEEVENMFYELEFNPLGLMSYDEFLNFEKLMGYQPSQTDISHVRWMLCRRRAKNIGTLLLRTFVENSQLAEQVRAVSQTG
nr:hypothetical protein FVER53263_05600 [Fusarium verticillioides]